MSFLKRYRDTFLVVLLVVVPFLFLRAMVTRPEELHPLDRALLSIASRIQYGAAIAARAASGVATRATFHLDVARDNDRLSREVLRLEGELRRLAGQERENERLRKLLGLKASLPVETVSAMVTTKAPTEFFRVIHLAVDADGLTLQKNMPVIALGGVVGLIKVVSGESATVQLVVDAGFGVDVVVSRTGARGFVRGTGDEGRYVVRVQDVDRTDNVEVGDLLVTSGSGCRFPKDIAVAKVTEVVKRDFGNYQEVVAVPTVDFSRLEEVLVIVSDPKECAVPRGRK
jgi:rod shape-determining protein MreC